MRGMDAVELRHIDTHRYNAITPQTVTEVTVYAVIHTLANLVLQLFTGLQTTLLPATVSYLTTFITDFRCFKVKSTFYWILYFLIFNLILFI
jgi:hypothetical protein